MRYLRPTALPEAVQAVAAGATPLAGGTILVPALSAGLAAPDSVVDIGRLPGLAGVTSAGGGLRIGATTTLAELAGSALPIGERALVEAATAAANPLIRRSATVGGNVAGGLAALDLPPCLLVLRAEVVLATDTGEVRQPVDTVLAGGARPGLIAAAFVPADGGRRSGYRKYAWRRATGTAVVSVAVAFAIERGRLVRPAVAVGGLPPHARRLPAAEALLDGAAPGPGPFRAAAERAAEAAVAGLGPEHDPAYRARLVELGVGDLLAGLAA